MSLGARRLVGLGAVAAALGAGAVPTPDLQTVRAEPDAVKRSRLAVGYGEQTAGRAAKACKANDYEQCVKLLREVGEAVELASKALDESGIDPTRNSGRHKYVEIRVRKILKLVQATSSYIHPDDQQAYEAVAARISEIDDRLVAAIMSRRKRR